MGKNKDAAVGFIIVGVIIAVIAGVVSLVLSPGETKTESGTVNEPVKKAITDRAISPEEEQKIEEVANEIASSLPEYQKTNEILKSYTTEEILDDILDSTTTELDRRIEYHSTTESKDGTNTEQLLYSVGEMEYEVTACKENSYPTDLDGLVQYFRYDLEFVIKDGYAKDPAITPILQRAKESISAYYNCINKSEKPDSQTTTASNGFDPAVVKAARENIGGIQNVAKGVLGECRKVKSYSDYQEFASAVSLFSDKFVTFAYDADATLSALEDRGYDKHPEVGPLIEETRDLYFETSLCLDDLADRYEN